MNAEIDGTASSQARSVRLHVRELLLNLAAYEKRKGSNVIETLPDIDAQAYSVSTEALKKS